ncbi:hypothetical protein, partial [Nocardia harenae]|uniref:hypothetical protein n=1 Tax=Nocardia harenae TaxID=358707 RepID=UPI001C3FC641
GDQADHDTAQQAQDGRVRQTRGECYTAERGSADCVPNHHEPFARQVALKAAADELNTFINDFREESGRQRYEASDAERDAMSFMETLKKQVSAYMEEAKRDMKAAGFETTPWD